MTIKNFEKLRILDDCKDIMRIIFKLVSKNPNYKYDVNPQLIRSGLLIGSNIAEGNQRKGKDRNRFLNIALGSLEECRFQLSIYPDYNIDKLEDKFDKIRATIINLSKKSLS